MDVPTAKNILISLVDSLEQDDRSEFLSWCKGRYFSDASYSQAYLDLRIIAEEIKTLVPIDAVLPSERVNHAGFDTNSEGETEKVLHVDSFLYEEDHIDLLVDEKKLSRNYCKRCGSTEVLPITFISHSISVKQLEFIFGSVLPDLSNKVVLDVGSRLGAVLYGAYYCSAAKKIIGVEMNKELYEIQSYIVNKFNLVDRIEVICDNLCNVPNIVNLADVIVLNNVFECFLTVEDQVGTWQWLKQAVKKGTLLVTVPSIEESLSSLETGIDISSWLRKLPVIEPDLMKMDDEDSMPEICTYVVL